MLPVVFRWQLLLLLGKQHLHHILYITVHAHNAICHFNETWKYGIGHTFLGNGDNTSNIGMKTGKDKSSMLTYEADNIIEIANLQMWCSEIILESYVILHKLMCFRQWVNVYIKANKHFGWSGKWLEPLSGFYSLNRNTDNCQDSCTLWTSSLGKVCSGQPDSS